MIDPDLRQIIEPKLWRTEELLWVGRPQKYRSDFKSVFVWLFFLSVSFCLLFWMPANNPDFRQAPNLFRYPFIGIFGLSLLSSILGTIADAFVIFAVTTKRGIVYKGLLFKFADTIEPSDLSQYEIIGGDNVGSIHFNTEYKNALGQNQKMSTRKFHDIKNPKDVGLTIFNQFVKPQ